MSSARMRLKVASIVMIVAGILLVPFTAIHFAFAANPPAVMLLALAAVVTVFDFLLGGLGRTAAILVERVRTLLPILLVALVTNVAATLYFFSLGAMWMPLLANTFITVLFAYAARAVQREALS